MKSNKQVKSKKMITETILSTRAKNLLLPNKKIKDKIAIACDVDYTTVHRWIMADKTDITRADAMKVIREETGLTDDQLLMVVEKIN